MVVLGGGAVSYWRGTPVTGGARAGLGPQAPLADTRKSDTRKSDTRKREQAVRALVSAAPALTVPAMRALLVVLHSEVPFFVDPILFLSWFLFGPLEARKGRILNVGVLGLYM